MTHAQRVLIVGGGVAGWLAACYLARTLGRAVQIDLLETGEAIPSGDGEGTCPSIRSMLAHIGIDEVRFLREAGATFKQGTRFAHWVRPPDTEGADHYFHPYSLPESPDGTDLLPYWLLGLAGPGVPFAESVTLQKRLADVGRAPKRFGDADYYGALDYGYQIDAARFAALLAEEGRGLGVGHHVAALQGVELAEDGAIESIRTRGAGRLTADLYLDCTGAQASLIGKALGVPWRTVADTLFADRMMTARVPYGRPGAPLPSYTVATAEAAGWTWDIGLQEGRSVGYIYSASHTDDGEAEAVLRRRAGVEDGALAVTRQAFEAGYRDIQWRKNCVAVGASAGLLEPLESSGLGLVEASVRLIAHLFPFDGNQAPVARAFNETMAACFRACVDFTKLHYCLSRRTDTAFWRDNVKPASIRPALREKLAMWRSRVPHRLDFPGDTNLIPPASWQFVLYGMEYETDLRAARAAYTDTEAAWHEFVMIARSAGQAMSDLPDHRLLINQLCYEDRQSRAS